MTQMSAETSSIGLDRRSRDKLARWAGAAYLVYIAIGAASILPIEFLAEVGTAVWLVIKGSKVTAAKPAHSLQAI